VERVRFPYARAAPAVALALTAVVLPIGPATSADVAPDVAPGAGAVRPKPRLLQPAHGPEAIRLLGDQLDQAAALSGWTVEELQRVLRTDPTAWVDEDGRVVYEDLPRLDGAESGTTSAGAVASVPLSETFLLHSKPGSTRTLLIDFDGTEVSGTAWNTSRGVPDGRYPAWSLDGDPGTFSDAERVSIQSIWQRVAEDYAPFDIDVTTEDPGPAALARTDPADQVYGVRALVTPSTVAEGAICGTPAPSCGGAAYTNVFGEVEYAGGTHQPAWVFPRSLGPNDTKDIAEAVSHEVGHTFGLQHDGRSSPAEGYYAGQAMWAPIMGEGYGRPVTQWSRGEYASANNTQDDVALIAARAPYRGDEAGGTVGTAASSVPPTGFITDRNDVDTFALGTCEGAVTVQATGAAPSPDLDLRLELLDAAGATLASVDPASAFLNRDSASGLAASVSARLTRGAYFARVDGVGNGTGAAGYTDYASVGAYGLAAFGCGGTIGVPGMPTGLTVSPSADGRSATMTWSAPDDSGSGPLAGYTVTRTSGAPVDLGLVGAHTWTDLTPGATYTFTVAARNDAGEGAPVSQQLVTPGGSVPSARRAPSAPTIKKAASGHRGGRRTALFAWTAPVDAGGLPLTGYRVQVLKADGTLVTTVPVAPGSTRFTLRAKRAARYRVVVIAQNRAGAGAPSAASRPVRAR
jgi:hypothetical protein